MINDYNKNSTPLRLSNFINPKNSEQPPNYLIQAPLVAAMGYPEAVPIARGKKSCYVEGWQNKSAAELLELQEKGFYENETIDTASGEIRTFKTKLSRCYTGIRTGFSEEAGNHLAAWDVDMPPGLEKEADLIYAILSSTLSNGKIVVRIGEGGFQLFHTSSDRIEKTTITFCRTTTKGNTKSFSINLRGDGDQSVISAIHPDSGCQYWYGTENDFFNTARNELPKSSAAETSETLQAIIEELAKNKNGGWLGRVTQGKGKSTKSVSSGLDPDLELPSEDWQNLSDEEVKKYFSIFDFRCAHYDQGVRDHDDFIPTIPELEEYKCWNLRDVIWAITSITRLNSDAGRELAFDILFCPDHTDPRYREKERLRKVIALTSKAYAKDKTSSREVIKFSTFIKVYNILTTDPRYKTKRSREHFVKYGSELEALSNQDYETLESIELAISQDDVLTKRDRSKLEPLCQKRLIDIGGEKRSIGVVRASIAFVGEPVKEPKKRTENDVLYSLIEEIEKEGYLFKDNFGQAYADITLSDGSVKTILLGDGMMCDHIRHEADKRFKIFIKKSVGDDAEDILRLRAERSDNVEEVFGRFGRGKCGRVQYEFLHDNACMVIETSAKGIRAVHMRDIDGRSILPKGAEPGVAHREIERCELRKFCIQLMRLMRVPKRYWPHMMTWLVASRHFGSEYPILQIVAPSGAGKSTMGEFAERITDPKAVRQLKVSKKLDGLQSVMAANHVTAQHNISKQYSADMQDLMCVASDGEVDSKRKAYSTNDSAVLSVGGPLILTTRFHGMTKAADVMNRTLVIKLESIGGTVEKLSKERLRQMLDDACVQYTPVIRALHSEVMRLLPDMPSSTADHLAHTRCIGEAICQVLDLPQTFDEILRTDKDDELRTRIDENLFICALIEYVVRRGGVVECDYVDLMKKMLLDEDQSDADARRESRYTTKKDDPSWPANVAEAKETIAKNADLLFLAGLELPSKVSERPRTKNGIVYRFKTNEHAPALSELQYKLTLISNPDLPEGPTRSSVVSSTRIEANHDGLFSALHRDLIAHHGDKWIDHAPTDMVNEYLSL